MDKMTITDAQYTSTNNATIRCIIDSIEMQVPTDPANRHYAEILKQVKEGTLTIKDAE